MLKKLFFSLFSSFFLLAGQIWAETITLFIKNPQPEKMVLSSIDKS